MEETISGLEKMLSSASDRKDSEAENALAEAVDYLTELGVLGFGRLPEEEPLRGFLVGQYFEHPDGEGLCIIKEDHMQAGGGGGGRIKVFYQTLNNTAALSVDGGTGGDDPALRDGQPGTVNLIQSQRSITVVWPKAGDEGIVLGDHYYITWDSENAGTAVKIEINTDNQGTW